MTHMSKGIGVFFDVDDTLYDHLEPLKYAISHTLGTESDFPYEEVYHRVRYYSDFLTEQNKGINTDQSEMGIEEMRRQRYILGLAEFGITIDEEQASRIQEQYYSQQFAISLYPGAEELIKELLGFGIVVGLITNGPLEHQRAKIVSLKMDKIIPAEHIFVSGGVGIDKPDPELYHHVNEKTGTLAAHSYYIGDSWNNDVVGALEAGWNSIWYNPRNAKPRTEHKPHYIVSGYEELRQVLLPLLNERYKITS